MAQTIAPGARASQPTDDIALADRACHGDEHAFRTIMERYNRRLYRVARSLLQDDSEAEDVVQEAYMRAFAAMTSYRGEASLATWLTRITVNEALGRKRKRRPTVELEAVEIMQESTAQIIHLPTMTSSDPERSTAQREIRKLLEVSIDKLPEPFRLVFVMRDIEELSIEETAALLGIRPQTVKTRLHRARRMLRESLDQQLVSSLKDTFPFAGVRCTRMTEAVLTRLRSQGCETRPGEEPATALASDRPSD
jgi:RNA polymerase sigma-70 factor (ECF subfamily)